MKRRFVVASLFIGFWAHFAVCGEAQTLRKVALSDDQAPGIESGTFLNGFSPPALNNAGQVAFQGVFDDPTIEVPPGTGIWSEGHGNGLDLIARSGDAPPGTDPGVYFSDFNWPLLNNQGQVAFIARIRGEGIANSRQGIWTETRGSGLEHAINNGDLPPGTAENIGLRDSGSLQLGANGSLVFRADLVESEIDGTIVQSIWTEGPDDSLALLVQGGSRAPGTEDGTTFDRFGYQRVNSAAVVVFQSGLRGPAIDTDNNYGIWRGRGEDELELIARRGDDAPGFEEGVTLTRFLGNVEINDRGQVAFRTSVIGPSVDHANDAALWLSTPGSELEVVAQEGMPAPGTEDGTVFSTIRRHVINELGHIAMRATLSGPEVYPGRRVNRDEEPPPKNNEGFWTVSDEGLSLIARLGDRAPGTEAGVVFDGFTAEGGSLTLNRHGQSTFLATLAGPSINSGNFGGLWAEDISGQLRKIVRIGDELDVDDGPGIDLRTVAGLGFVGDDHQSSVPRSGFNDLGQVAFLAGFTDGTQGIFVSNLVAVPEPSLFSLLSMGAAGLYLVRREERGSRSS